MNAYDELSAWTLNHGDPAFIHQHVVDAHCAQSADAATKPIAITFALVGLYLHLERGFTGREVQRAHMVMARKKEQWPAFELPHDRGAITAADVLRRTDRETAIDEWCAAVWSAYRASREAVIALVARYPSLK